MAAKVYGDGGPDGMKLGVADELIAFYGGTPVVQPSGANQGALVDNSAGTASLTLAAGVAIGWWLIPLQLAGITGNVDVLTAWTPGFAGTILSVDFWVTKVASTASKLASLNLEIDTTNLTGGVVALTTANCTPLGATVAGSAVTAANVFTAAQTISIEAASVTAFVEGDGFLAIKYRNDDLANAIAGIAAAHNAIRTGLVTNLNVLKGSA